MQLFISYAHDDMPICKQFVKLLEAHEVWFDQNLRGGEEWWQRILDRLAWCEGLIYLLSPASVESEYCRREANIALSSGKVLIPVIIHRRAQMPEFLKHIQYIDLSEGLESVESVLQLMNTLFFAERLARSRHISEKAINISETDNIPPIIKLPTETDTIRNLPYNYIYRLDQRGVSENTKYVYMRWVCDYLERIAGLPPIAQADRVSVLSKLSINVLEQSLSVAQINAWLGMLKLSGNSKLSVAKSAILAFVETLVEDHVLDKELVEKIRAIEAYKLDFDKRPRRWLSYEQVEALMGVLTSDTKMDIRNAAAVSLLMVLRTGEVNRLRWKHISMLGNRVTIQNPVSNNIVQIPSSVHKYIIAWYKLLSDHEKDSSFEETFVIRRSYRKNFIGNQGVSTVALQDIVASTAHQAGIGKLSPDDLRISVRQLMEQKGRETF